LSPGNYLPISFLLANLQSTYINSCIVSLIFGLFLKNICFISKAVEKSHKMASLFEFNAV